MTNEEFGQMMSKKDKKTKRIRFIIGISIVVIIIAFIISNKYVQRQNQEAEDEKYYQEFLENQVKDINNASDASKIESIIGSMRVKDYDRVKSKLASIYTKSVYWETGKLYYDDFTGDLIKRDVKKQNGTYNEYLKSKKSRNELIEKVYLPSKNQKAKKIKDKYGWDNSTCLTVSEGKISIGMTSDMVREAWGKPKDINKTIYSFGVHEQWVYGIGNYVYFEDGKVTTIQN